MLGFLKSCWAPLHRRIRRYFRRLTKSDKASMYNRKRKLASGYGVTSSFATMEVSDQLRQVFKIIDGNDDGKISSLELSEILVCLGQYNKSRAAKEAEVMLRFIDDDGDGFIDLDEFMNAVDVDGNNDGEEDYLMDAFLIFDSDKNGLISAKELRRVLVSLGFDDYSIEDCRRMIKGIDKDGDGFVDFQEFRSMMTRHPTPCK